MSAVSSGPPQGNAEVRAPEASQEPGPLRQPANAPHRPGEGPGERRAAPDHASQADFGANEWLVEELYQRYLADPGSVDRAWWSFFADYQPTLPNGTGPQPVIGLQGAPQAPAPQKVSPPSPTPSGPQSSPGAEAPRAQQAPAQVPAPPAAVPSPPSPAAPAPPSPAPPSPPALPSPKSPLLPAQLCPLRLRQLCLLPQPHPKVPRSAGCAAPRHAPSPT
jgi:hypothetical protein